MGISSDSTRPFYSIIITCYNYGQYVEQAITSALAQKYRNFEIIVIDDGSTDDSRNVISKYENQVITVFTTNNGFINACSKGLSLSSGTHLIFLDADDVLDPETLSAASTVMYNKNVSKVQFMMQPIDKAGRKIGRPFPNLNLVDATEHFKNNIFRYGCYATPPTSGNIYRRDVYEVLGDVSYDYGIDGVAYLLAPFVGEVVHLPQVLAYYRIHDENMSGSSLNGSLLSRNEFVFLERLQHLKELLNELKMDGEDFDIRDDYIYLLEIRLTSAILAGRRCNVNQYRTYARAVLSENRKKGIVLTAFFSLLIILPRDISKNILRFRYRQSRLGGIRSLIKRVLSV